MSDREAPRVYYMIEEDDTTKGSEKFDTLKEALERFYRILEDYITDETKYYILSRVEEFYRNERDMYPDNNTFILSRINKEIYQKFKNKEKYIKNIKD